MSDPNDETFVRLVPPLERFTLDLSWCRPRRADLTDPLASRPDIPTTVVVPKSGIVDGSGFVGQYLIPAPPSAAMTERFEFHWSPPPKPEPFEFHWSPPPATNTPDPVASKAAAPASSPASTASAATAPDNLYAFPQQHEPPRAVPFSFPSGWEPLTTPSIPDEGLAASVQALAGQVQALQSLIIETIVPALGRGPIAPVAPTVPTVFRDVQRTVVRNQRGEDTVVASTEEVIIVDPVTGNRNRETTTSNIVGNDGRTINPNDRTSTCHECYGLLTEPRPCLICRVPLCPTCARYTINEETEEVRVYCPTHAPSSGMGFLELLAAGIGFIASLFS